MIRPVWYTRIVSLSLAVFFSTFLAAQQPSLGDIARQARKNKPEEPTTKVITNDDLRSGAISPEPTNTDSESKAGEDVKPSEPSAESKAKAEEAKSKAAKDLQDQIAAQRDKITQLQTDIDKLQQQSKQRASNYYADAGTRLRDPKKYADDIQKDKDNIASKQKELEDARTKLAQLEDQARKDE